MFFNKQHKNKRNNIDPTFRDEPAETQHHLQQHHLRHLDQQLKNSFFKKKFFFFFFFLNFFFFSTISVETLLTQAAQLF